MRINIVGKNVKITDGMRSKIEEKLYKLEKYDFIKENATVNVMVRTVKDNQIIEVTIPVANNKVIRAEKRDHDLYAAIDMVEETLSRQMRKAKEKCQDKRHLHTDKHLEEEVMDENEITIVREKVVPCELMSPEDAVDMMESLDHDFHLFVNKNNNHISVVYRRKDGNYGLISSPQES